MKPGTLLTPNAYMVQNGNPTCGVVLETKTSIREKQKYKVFLTNGLTHWLNEVTIRSLFDSADDEGSHEEEDNIGTDAG